MSHGGKRQQAQRRRLWRLGSISKQGNRFMRMLLVEAAQIAVRCDPQMRSEYLHRCQHRSGQLRLDNAFVLIEGHPGLNN